MPRKAKGEQSDSPNMEIDGIQFVGNIVEIPRIMTGLWSLDRAFMGFQNIPGIPICPIELYGPTSSGKSSFAYSLAAICGRETGKRIALGDLEGFEPSALAAILRGVGYTLPMHVINGNTAGEVLDKLLETVMHDDMIGGILDSVAAISPVSELNSGSEEANMGRRAKTVSTHMRKMINFVRSNPRMFLYTNHTLPNITWVGSYTPGGQGLHYLNAIRIRMKSEKFFPQDGSFIIAGDVEKNRYGFKDRTFSAFFLMGYGLHPGMTAIWDCLKMKVLSLPKGESQLRWKETGETIPKLAAYAKAARAGDNSVFEPFHQALANLDSSSIVTEEDTEDAAEDKPEED